MPVYFVRGDPWFVKKVLAARPRGLQYRVEDKIKFIHQGDTFTMVFDCPHSEQFLEDCDKCFDDLISVGETLLGTEFEKFANVLKMPVERCANCHLTPPKVLFSSVQSQRAPDVMTCYACTEVARLARGGQPSKAAVGGPRRQPRLKDPENSSRTREKVPAFVHEESPISSSSPDANDPSAALPPQAKSLPAPIHGNGGFGAFLPVHPPRVTTETKKSQLQLGGGKSLQSTPDAPAPIPGPAPSSSAVPVVVVSSPAVAGVSASSVPAASASVPAASSADSRGKGRRGNRGGSEDGRQTIVVSSLGISPGGGGGRQPSNPPANP